MIDICFYSKLTWHLLYLKQSLINKAPNGNYKNIKYHKYVALSVWATEVPMQRSCVMC